MRIIGGVYRGRTLVPFDGYDIRPTADSTRESLFNIIGDKIEGKSFLDLFCGTGAVGIEAKSRGAKKVVINDVSRTSLLVAKKNLAKLGETEIKCLNYDAVSLLKMTADKFDYIFIDAPYNEKIGLSALNLSANAIEDGGVVIFENDKPFTGSANGLEKFDERKYGRAYLTFFNKISDCNCVFAGTFDPITVGHEDVILECAKSYGKVFVVLGENKDKRPMLTSGERLQLLKKVFGKTENVEVVDYSDYKKDYGKFLQDNDVKVYVRGIRDEKDYKYEKKYERENKKLYPFIKTVYVRGKFDNVSSSLIRDKISKGQDVSKFIPDSCHELLKKILDEKKNG